jgi:GntR family transcriptional regulator
VPPYQQIKDQVKTQIAMGHLKPGEALPVIRQLAKDLVVNPNTVARAYRDLEFEGLLASKTGSGTFVTDQGLALSDQAKEEKVRDLLLRAVVEGRNLKVPDEAVRALFEDIMTDMEGGADAVPFPDGEMAKKSAERGVRSAE